MEIKMSENEFIEVFKSFVYVGAIIVLGIAIMFCFKSCGEYQIREAEVKVISQKVNGTHIKKGKKK